MATFTYFSCIWPSFSNFRDDWYITEVLDDTLALIFCFYELKLSYQNFYFKQIQEHKKWKYYLKYQERTEIYFTKHMLNEIVQIFVTGIE